MPMTRRCINSDTIKDIENDLGAQAQDCYIAVETLCEVLKSRQPLIVYFPDSSQWLHKSVPKSYRNEFFNKVEEMFDKLSGPVVLICGENKVQSGSKEKEQFTMILPNFGRASKLPLSLKRLTDGFKGAKSSEDDDVQKLFSNVLCVHPPKDDNLLATFKKQLDEDRKFVISRSNLNELRKVLEEHQLSCTDLLHVNTDDVILTKQSMKPLPDFKTINLILTYALVLSSSTIVSLPSNLHSSVMSCSNNVFTSFILFSEAEKSLAKDEFESNFISAVVPSDEIGVKFDDIGALEDVKKALNELVILPMRRPELFSRGNLLRVMNLVFGILLFGPPGTGKTLLAKALATEAGANFISITGSTLTSKWFGDAEKLTKALFSFASKLAPVIIFVDEVDSLLGARGGALEHEATRRMRNEFMAAWDGLRSKENQRILILGATNRPFDLDDAVIRRLPRRIYVDLPDAENRMKILRIVLAQENLVPSFEYDKLAKLTEGYSGSDLKNLCIAAAYRPVQELIEEEKKVRRFIYETCLEVKFANYLFNLFTVKDIENDLDAQAQDCYIAVEALCEVLKCRQPLIVYFPDSSQWLHKSVPKSYRNEFFNKVEEMFDKLSGPVVLICGENKVQSGSKEKEQFTMILPNFGRASKLPLSLKRLTDGFKGAKSSEDDDVQKLFSNVLCVHPPKDDNLLATFKKQLDEDRKFVISRSNLNELRKVLEEHQLSCTDLLHVNTDDVILTKQKAEKVVGWAKNHYLSSCLLPSVKGERLCLPRESLEIAISRMKGQETLSRKPSQNLKSLAKDEFESNFISAVVPSDEIGVKFDDIGALEDVKKALNELVILPMRRPELFSRGNLLRPCKGILLFGPPGTGKTLLAKALATEAGANFISITGSTLTSKWFGDAEKLTKALFSFASKLAPVIIFVDEVDSLLGARGGALEHEATRRMRNEFMAAWDGLRSKENQRILILGATNRPFDLDDAVIRRLPRRIYVDLPDAENRMKILRIVLAQENLIPGFEYDKLAKLTEGYSGSDLKNLCIAAAYRPVQELREEEKKGISNGTPSVLRPLNVDDFVESKAKVGPSVAYDATSMNELRKWNDMYGEDGSRTKSPFGFGS
ncbi:PREDICTED: uncharacterized protein LOC109354045 [Lupinus angustifolius]|uniref:uncharacterized protein LOC109354045 n=1 Tax=Lupinus angustifolius TaxID=3871 RepID=UPI00092ED56B|nr:PREDICTED: uncharacterized protein LOC109354045 [Lupinus angustifolius]